MTSLRLLSPFALVLFAASLAAGCGGNTGDSDPSGGGGGTDEIDAGTDTGTTPPPTIPWACNGATIQRGSNENFPAAGQSRSFIVDLPTDTTKPLGVVVSWHGLGDSADNFHDALGLDPNADPDFPFIVVTMESTKLLPPAGIEWQIFDVAGDQREFALFETVLGCLNQTYTIDTTRIYSMGFSAGAIMTDMIHAHYQGRIAATLAYSGAWFDDAAEVSGVNTVGLSIKFDWEPLDPAIGGTHLMTHGGVNDGFGFGTIKIIDFEKSAQAAVPFLQAGKRTIVDCAHTRGHQPHPGVGPDQIVSFFKAHKLGEKSPWAGGLPSGWPSSCKVE